TRKARQQHTGCDEQNAIPCSHVGHSPEDWMIGRGSASRSALPWSPVGGSQQPESKPRGMKDGVSPIRGAVESVERPTRLRGTASSYALSCTLLTRDDH